MSRDFVKNRYDILIPAIICLILFIFKVVFIIDNRTMPQVSDEFGYEFFSRSFMLEQNYNSVQYPLLYPLILIPAYLFSDYYTAMKVINSIFSALVPFVVYHVARLYVGKKESTIAAIFSAIVPFQYITTMTLMSENVYFLLLMLAIYVLLKESKRNILTDIILGALLGMMFLTRHITLVIIPVFAFAWVMKQINNKVKFKDIILRGLLIVVVLTVIYSPWVIMCLGNGYTFKETIGFKIASRTNPEQLTLKRLIMSAGFYLSYYMIICAPFLGVLVKSIRGLDIKFSEICSKYNQICVLIFGLAAAFFTAVTRHSWRAYYNYPDFEKIKGRYLLYFPTLFIIIAVIVLFYKKTKFKNNILNIILTYIFPVIGIVIGYMIDVEGVVYPLGGTFIGSIESVDGQKVKLIGISFIFVVSIVICFYQYIYDFGKGKIQKYFMIIFAVSVIGLELWGMPQYLSFINDVNEKQNNTNNAYANEFLSVVDEISKDEDITYILVDKISDYNFITRTKRFRHYDDVVITKVVENVKENIFYYVTDNYDEFENQIIEDVYEFNWDGKVYYMKKLKIG